MGRLAAAACRELDDVIADPISVCSAYRERADDRTDALRRDLLEAVRHAHPPYPARVGVDVALLTRYIERYADQAVAVARQLDYVVTGEMPRHARC
jgi:phosphate transport system protein